LITASIDALDEEPQLAALTELDEAAHRYAEASRSKATRHA
jgi:hypothetical protein